MGRPAKPTALTMLDGDGRKNPPRINRSEPVPCATGAIVPTFELTEDARAVWDRLAPDRSRQGVLTEWDADAFSLFVEALAIARAKVGPALAPWDPKASVASPLSELKAAIAMVSSLGSQFGWTPSARARLTTEPAGRDDPAAKYLS